MLNSNCLKFFYQRKCQKGFFHLPKILKFTQLNSRSILFKKFKKIYRSLSHRYKAEIFEHRQRKLEK